MLKRAYEISQGVKVKEVPLDDLAKSWAKLPRSRAITKRHEMECMRRLNKFVDFVQKNYRNLQYLSQITPQIAHHYLRYEQGRGIAPKTYNDILKLLRSAFEQLREDGQNPFKKIPTQESETIFRKPYTEEELYSLREATHLTSFGLEPGDKEASALADKLISEMVNKKFAALQIKLPATSEILSNDPKCLFGIFKHPTFKCHKRK